MAFVMDKILGKINIFSKLVGQYLYSYFFNQLHLEVTDLLLGRVIYLQQPFHL